MEEEKVLVTLRLVTEGTVGFTEKTLNSVFDNFLLEKGIDLEEIKTELSGEELDEYVKEKKSELIDDIVDFAKQDVLQYMVNLGWENIKFETELITE